MIFFCCTKYGKNGEGNFTYRTAQCSWNLKCLGHYMVPCPHTHTQTHTHTRFPRAFFISFSKEIIGSEANQRNNKILRIFVIFVKLPRGDFDHASANVADIKNKWFQDLHPVFSTMSCKRTALSL
jgi:hypothetical protein